MCGEVRIDGAIERDPHRIVPADAPLEIEVDRFVSRGGVKLEAALLAWDVPVAGKIWLDAGVSTGGFTDCLLQHGAIGVHAVDVGYNQIAYRLRTDERVILHERTNINAVETLDPPPVAAVCDLSFRSLSRVLVTILSLTTEGWGIALLKPQFEAAAMEKTDAIPGGVVKAGERDAIVRHALDLLDREGATVERVLDSPLPGRKGNRELLILARLSDAGRRR
jgi:23S rRNA (cytidine1920-2'-O)/16S rRNA (cytidine1409-2'-O)-methyltransferase